MTRIFGFFLFLGCLLVFSGDVHADGMARYGLQDVCGGQIVLSSPLSGTSSAAILVPKKFSSYLENSYCTVYIRASSPFNYGITISVRTMDLRPYSVDTLTIRYMDLFERNVVFQNALPNQHREHDNFESKSYHSTTNATITFRTLTGGYRTFSFDGFELIITATSKAPCSSYEFQCGRYPPYCISNDLRCDGHNHCGDMSDQSNCGPSTGTIVGSVFGCIFLVVAIVCCIVIIRRRSRGGTTTTRIITTGSPQPAYVPPPVHIQYAPPPPYNAPPTYVGSSAAPCVPAR